MPTAAIVQLTSTNNVSENLKTCRKVVLQAAEEGAKIVFLPEASDFVLSPPFPKDHKSAAELAKPLDESNTFIEGLRSTARDGNVYISVGIHESSEDSQKCYNTLLLIDPMGDIVQAYRKTHLFDVDIKDGATILESATTMKGPELLPPVRTPVGNLGNLICYDLRFPEASLRLRRLGAHSIAYPSAFTMKTGKAHWEVLLRSRAIETQCYVFAAAQFGSHAPAPLPSLDDNSLNKPNDQPRISYGNAMAVDPWGNVLLRLPAYNPSSTEDESEAIFGLINVDLTWLEKVREDMPLWEQRRDDIYGTL